MKPRGITTVMLALLLTSACGGGANATPDSGPTYADTAALINKVTEVVYCEDTAKEGPFTTVYSERSENCDYTAADGVEDQMIVSTFANAKQQEDGVSYLVDSNVNPGKVYVQGNGWLVATDGHFAPAIAKNLGGKVVTAGDS